MIKRETFTYKNGLKHVHYHVPFLKNISVSFYVKTGSANEDKPELEGISHFLEHMLFNGSEKYPDHKEASRLVASNGLYQNAWTWYNMTNYYLVGSKEALPVMMDILFDRVFNPLLREKDVEKEKGVVLEELSMYENNPEFRLYLKVKGQLYSGTTYSHEVIGTKKSISAYTRKMLVDYHKTFYSAHNVILVTYGGATIDEIHEHSDKLIEQLVPVEVPAFNSEVEVPENRDQKIAMEMDVKSSFYTYILKLPLVQSEKELASYILFTYILSGGVGSTFDQRLLVKESLVSSYGCDFRPFRSHSQISFEASLNKENLTVVRDIVHEEFTKLLNGVSDEEFERAQNYSYGTFIRAIEDVYLTTGTDWSNPERLNFLLSQEIEVDKVVDGIKSMTKEEFLTNVNKLIDLTNYKEGILTPKTSKD